MKNLKFAAFVFLLGLEVFAMESIGRVVKVHGDVSNHQDGSSQVLKRGDHLYVGSKIISGKASFIKIYMKDDTIFQLGPNSEFALEKFEFKTKSERTAVYNLAKGKLRSLFTVKAPTRSLKIKTPTASMGVRGTEILSDVYKFKGKLTTDIALLSGSLEVQTKGIQKRMMIKPGFVYQSSLSDSIKKNAINSKIRRMDKRVFSRARMAKGMKNVFLTDVRKSVDKKMVKDVDFNIEKTIKRVPASNVKEIKKAPKDDQVKSLNIEKAKPRFNTAPKIKSANLKKIDATKIDIRKLKKEAMFKRIQSNIIQNDINIKLAPPPPTKTLEPAPTTSDPIRYPSGTNDGSTP